MKKVSIIFQGPVNNFTQAALESARSFYPKDQIVLSTWEDEDVKNLRTHADSLVLSSTDAIKGRNNHQNFAKKQHTSLAGLSAAENEHVVIVRTDIAFTSDTLRGNVLDCSLDGVVHSDLRIFRSKIRHPNWYCFADKKPLYFTEAAHAGLAEDLVKYLSCGFIPDVSSKHSYIFLQDKPYKINGWDCGNENTLPCLFASKHLNYKFGSSESFASKEEKDMSDKILFENFILLDGDKEFGVRFLKHPSYSRTGVASYYREISTRWNIDD